MAFGHRFTGPGVVECIGSGGDDGTVTGGEDTRIGCCQTLIHIPRLSGSVTVDRDQPRASPDAGDEQVVNIGRDVVRARGVGDEFDSGGLVLVEQRLPHGSGELLAQGFVPAQVDRGVVSGRHRRGGHFHSEITGAQHPDVEGLGRVVHTFKDPFGVSEVIDRQSVRVGGDFGAVRLHPGGEDAVGEVDGLSRGQVDGARGGVVVRQRMGV